MRYLFGKMGVQSGRCSPSPTLGIPDMEVRLVFPAAMGNVAAGRDCSRDVGESNHNKQGWTWIQVPHLLGMRCRSRPDQH